jgi:hypothetical protein
MGKNRLAIIGISVLSVGGILWYFLKGKSSNDTNIIGGKTPILGSGAVVLPTVESVIQSTSIQEEDINTLDCTSLQVKYDAILNQLNAFNQNPQANSSNISLMSSRKVLIENIMKSKNCIIKEPINLVTPSVNVNDLTLDNIANINTSLNAPVVPVKYTNAEISDFGNIVFENFSNYVEDRIRNAILNPENDSGNYTFYQVFAGKKYVMKTKLLDFLKTLKTKQEVDKFLVLYPTLMDLIIGYPYIPQRNTYKSQRLSLDDSAFLGNINYSDNLIYS